MNKPSPHLLALSLALACGSTAAAVSPEEAARLKSELTPLGAELAGNKDGTIPAWSGGYLTPVPGDKPGGRRGDPFKDEKPLFSITSKNLEQYAERLSEGQKAMLKKYPETYRLDVYKTHRTAAAPRWVYDNTFKNATAATLDGYIVEGAYGGIPFPIPKTGAEVMWNHVLRWRPPSVQVALTQYQLTSDGRAVLRTDGVLDQQMPYYFQKGSAEQFAKAPDYWLIRLISTGPAARAGEGIVGRLHVDGNKDQSWVYLTGQRRVRRLPVACCDTPSPSAAGAMSFDEMEVFNGRLDRFDWKLVGKKEMYIPYNTNKLMQPKADADVLGQNHLNPEHVRWELHRVWVVDATLRAGQQHRDPKSRYYCDEDTWTCVLGERYTSAGQLKKSLWANVFVAPDIPATTSLTFGFNDLESGQAFVANLLNAKSAQYVVKPPYSDDVFTPDGMAAQGVR